jgi:hypothetical protein
MRINGTLVEFQGSRTDSDMESDAENERWREVFRGMGITATLDLKQTAVGDDTIAFEGSVVVKRGREHKRFVISGGCAA